MCEKKNKQGICYPTIQIISYVYTKQEYFTGMHSNVCFLIRHFFFGIKGGKA